MSIIPETKKTDTANLQQSLNFFLWSLMRGGPYADDLRYIPLPWISIQAILTEWKQALPEVDIKALVEKIKNESALVSGS
ncbi:MAG: hypothetical protein AAGA27_08460 [Pseudomonadota bacterium]